MRKSWFAQNLLLGLILAGCTLPAAGLENPAQPDMEPPSAPAGQPANAGEASELPVDAEPAPELMAGERVQPEQIIYLGAFRLPGPSGVSNWEYSGHGLTHYPAGDPSGPMDGFPGSLFGIGHDHQLAVSEISIPEPVKTQDLGQMNTAQTLTPFVQPGAGLVDLEAMSLPRAGLSYLPGSEDGRLHFCYADHLDDGLPTHGTAGLDLSHAEGLWQMGGFSNFTTCDYIFEIPPAWAEVYAPGMQLATGRFREGVWGGQGPALFAYRPEPENGEITQIIPLLMYGIQEAGGLVIQSDETTRMDGYQLADHWTGAAWLTADASSAVVFLGTKAMGSSWYGFANGVTWEYDCADTSTCPEVPDWPYDNRGYWAEDYQAQLLFFDVDQLGAVAQGELQPYHPQPYAVLDLTPYLLDPSLDYANYKRDLVGSIAVDAGNGYLFILERLADEALSVVHVFKLEGR